jgi:hypothetical protein
VTLALTLVPLTLPFLIIWSLDGTLERWYYRVRLWWVYATGEGQINWERLRYVKRLYEAGYYAEDTA